MKLLFKTGKIRLDYDCETNRDYFGLFAPTEIMDELFLPLFHEGKIKLDDIDPLGFVSAPLTHEEIQNRYGGKFGKLFLSSLYSKTGREFVIPIYEYLYMNELIDYAQYCLMLTKATEILRIIAHDYHFGEVYLESQSRKLEIILREGKNKALDYRYISNLESAELFQKQMKTC